MARVPTFQDNYQPQFSGHETFPLRYGWLKKVFDRVSQTENQENNRQKCWGDDAIAEFGVGKNMVSSMRHWAKLCDVIEEVGTNKVETTKFGQLLFAENGLDPYMESPSSLWLIHWHLARNDKLTTWFWFFNYFVGNKFEREELVDKLERQVSEHQWSRVASKTLKNDVGCFIRTYVSRLPTVKSNNDDSLESPLTELGLIKASSKSSFRIVRGPKSSLRDDIFVYALIDYWLSHFPDSSSLSFEAITHQPSSPGKVFALNDNDVIDRLIMLQEITNGKLRWSETAGLKQVIRTTKLDENMKFGFLITAFDAQSRSHTA
ncbi:DUF4007 family protein [Methylophaga sp.]|uniref:DUF4007 family protein n=1 Tax=Methylophaga sp. TaxID=2024840 RepID=UPI0013FE76E2|nr:DUF4007 family protein [Methylophaga sp.]MTI63321.1 DUF4007 family protein [Methylophaga sp.]